jgi:hypothetical protein
VLLLACVRVVIEVQRARREVPLAVAARELVEELVDDVPTDSALPT